MMKTHGAQYTRTARRFTEGSHISDDMSSFSLPSHTVASRIYDRRFPGTVPIKEEIKKESYDTAHDCSSVPHQISLIAIFLLILSECIDW